MIFFFKKFKILIFSIFILTIGILLRHHQLNFEDYWFDEIISFWQSDPSISFNQTLNRAKSLDGGTSLFFNIILKYFFYFFGYSPEIGRYVPFIFGILSIPLISYLSYLYFPSKTNFLLTIFLTSFNWHLISYSQETRLYSLYFLLSILSLIFFNKIGYKTENKYSLKYSFFYILFTSLGIINHIFFLIIIFSKLFFIFLNFFENKKKSIFLLFNIFMSVGVYLLIMHEYLISTISQTSLSWIKQVDFAFFTNFYFSRFFGSKIMGLLFLTCLIFLIIKFRKEILYKLNEITLMFIIIVFAYLIPLTYSLIFKPILTDRYICFVLIPILIIISIYTTRLSNKYLFLSFIFLLSSTSLINTYLEVFKRNNSKPEFSKALTVIMKSDIKNVYIKENPNDNKIINYLKRMKHNTKDEINFFSDELKMSKKNFWFLCYKPLYNFDCSMNNSLNNLYIIQQKDFKLLKLTSFSMKD